MNLILDPGFDKKDSNSKYELFSIKFQSDKAGTVYLKNTNQFISYL